LGLRRGVPDRLPTGIKNRVRKKKKKKKKYKKRQERRGWKKGNAQTIAGRQKKKEN